ncbi:hypothetical protein BpHYR1_003264, partial [Brachionus plicatilis]
MREIELVTYFVTAWSPIGGDPFYLLFLMLDIVEALIGSILDYNFPCLNSFSESGFQKLQVIQNTDVRCILKLPLRTSSESLFYEAENKLNIKPLWQTQATTTCYPRTYIRI